MPGGTSAKLMLHTDGVPVGAIVAVTAVGAPVGVWVATTCVAVLTVRVGGCVVTVPVTIDVGVAT